jgi:hypothetical protein
MGHGNFIGQDGVSGLHRQGKCPLARLELFEWRWLLRAHLAGLDVGHEKILAARGAAGEAAQHG